MFDSNIVKILNSKNISSDDKETRKRLESMWKSTTKLQKQNAVEIGGYSDTRSFNRARTSGQISVRMVIALALALDVDPFYISADVNVKSNCTDEKILHFMRKYGFEDLADNEFEKPTKTEVINYISQIFDSLNSEKRESIRELSNEELATLLSSTLIRAKIGYDDEIKLFLLKVLLTY